MALIPGGAPLSFSLVSIYLVASGSLFAGVGLFIWGSVELFIVDKTLRPKLVGGPIKLPFLPTFFGLIGGVKTMGFLGIFIGPVLMALLVAIWREWLREVELGDQTIQADAVVVIAEPPPPPKLPAGCSPQGSGWVTLPVRPQRACGSPPLPERMRHQRGDQDRAADQAVRARRLRKDQPDPDRRQHRLQQVEHRDFRAGQIARSGRQAEERDRHDDRAVEDDPPRRLDDIAGLRPP